MKETLLIGLGFCSIASATVTPEALEKAEQTQEIALDAPVAVSGYRGMHFKYEEGAIPGVYKAGRKDSKGVYYFGPDRSVWMTSESIQKIPRLYVGGIYLPNDPTQQPRFFYIFETEVYTTENIDTYIRGRDATVGSQPAHLTGSRASRVGAGAAGDAIGAGIVDLIIKSEVGKIDFLPFVKDPTLSQKIRAAIRPATPPPIQTP